MCNLYSVTKPQSAIRELATAMVDRAAEIRRTINSVALMIVWGRRNA
jgi:hypothetical protein